MMKPQPGRKQHLVWALAGRLFEERRNVSGSIMTEEDRRGACGARQFKGLLQFGNLRAVWRGKFPHSWAFFRASIDDAPVFGSRPARLLEMRSDQVCSSGRKVKFESVI